MKAFLTLLGFIMAVGVSMVASRALKRPFDRYRTVLRLVCTVIAIAGAAIFFLGYEKYDLTYLLGTYFLVFGIVTDRYFRALSAPTRQIRGDGKPASENEGPDSLDD
jgi:predicted tellurium resistance membrane protein TerC